MTRSKLIACAAALLPLAACAITATKEYVDRRDAEYAAVASNEVEYVHIIAATNSVDIAALKDAVATNAAGILKISDIASGLVLGKADAEKRVTINTGAGATNLVVRPVYANVNLVIRECETANGQKQYRLIRKED